MDRLLDLEEMSSMSDDHKTLAYRCQERDIVTKASLEQAPQPRPFPQV